MDAKRGWIAYTQHIVSLALIARTVQRLAAPYRVVHFLSVDRHLLGSIESEPYLVTSDIDHRYDDVVVDDDAFVLFARQYEHSLSFTPGPSLRLTHELHYPAGPRRLLISQPFLV